MGWKIYQVQRSLCCSFLLHEPFRQIHLRLDPHACDAWAKPPKSAFSAALWEQPRIYLLDSWLPCTWKKKKKTEAQPVETVSGWRNHGWMKLLNICWLFLSFVIRTPQKKERRRRKKKRSEHKEQRVQRRKEPSPSPFKLQNKLFHSSAGHTITSHWVIWTSYLFCRLRQVSCDKVGCGIG